MQATSKSGSRWATKSQEYTEEYTLIYSRFNNFLFPWFFTLLNIYDLLLGNPVTMQVTVLCMQLLILFLLRLFQYSFVSSLFLWDICLFFLFNYTCDQRDFEMTQYIDCFCGQQSSFFSIILHWIIAVPTAAGRKPMSLFLWGAGTESLFFPSSHQGEVQGSSLSTLQAGALQGALLSAWFLGCSLGFGDHF